MLIETLLLEVLYDPWADDQMNLTVKKKSISPAIVFHHLIYCFTGPPKHCLQPTDHVLRPKFRAANTDTQIF